MTTLSTGKPGNKPIVILGVFVADAAYRAARQPRLGETVLGRQFVLGPGGKGSNQSVAAGRLRSEEHTSELQSLMRISYAVFCLKKKTKSPSYQFKKNKKDKK